MMMTRQLTACALYLLSTAGLALPNGFVYLHQLAPDIEQDMRYAQNYNFIGQPVPGYHKGLCILSKETALQLYRANQAIQRQGYRIKVYDCYRPQRAVDAFYQWSKDKNNQKMKDRFYPREAKADLFKNGYIARRSGHSRGSTVDLTLVKIGKSQAVKSPLTACYDRSIHYLDDNSIDMGTRHDCLDRAAHYDYVHLSNAQKKNRQRLKQLMQDYDFRPYSKEWWHFTLNKEPYPNRYFNFNVE